MDTEVLITVAAMPFYTIAVIVCAYAANYAMHAAKTLNDSATEQKLTETVQDKV